MDKLKSLRARVDEWDKKLLDALAGRIDVVDEIGDLKDEHGEKIENTERESEVMSTRVSWGSNRGLPTSLVREIFEQILTYSKKRQERA